jgi:sugar phosphate isomerase/epimerase
MSPPPALALTSLLIAAASSLPAGAAPAGAAPGAPQAPWISLFDGKTLKGWVQRGGAARYAVKDGAIVGYTVPNTKNTFLCTARRYGDFVLELEFKVDPELNSGVQIRGQSRPDYQDGRVHGYQVEIDPDVKRGRMWTGGLYDEGRRGWLVDLRDNDAARQAFRPGAWNRMRVEARGDRIKTWINDVPAADLVDAKDLDGFIGLQVHQVGKREEPLTVAWRRLRLQDLGRRAWRPVLPGKDGEKARLPGEVGRRGDGSFEVTNQIVGSLPAGASRAGLALLPPLSAAGDGIAFRAEVKVTSGNGGLYLDARAAEGLAQAAGLQVDLDARRGPGLYESGGRGWLWRAAEAGARAPASGTERPGGDAAAPAEAEGDGAPAARTTRTELAARAIKSWKAGDWNWVTVSVHDGQVQLSLNDLPAARTTLAAAAGGAAPGQLAIEVAPAGGPSALAVRRLEVMSALVPPPVPGHPIGWCIRANGSAPEDAEAAGFEHVELALQDVLGLSDADFDKLAARLAALAAAGVPALAGYNFFPDDLALIGPSADRARLDAHLGRGLPRLQRLGLSYLVWNSGPARKAPEGLPPAQARQQLVEVGRHLAREARKHRLTVLLQPLRSTDTNQVLTVAEAVEVVKAVAQPNFQLLADWSFMHIQNDPAPELARAGARLRHVWIARPGPRTYPVAGDAAEYDALFAELGRLRYRGGLSVHARTDNFFADAPEALRFLRLRAAELSRRK